LSSLISDRSLLHFYFYSYGDHRDLHSFPTRRSSDLKTLHIAQIRSPSGSAPFLRYPRHDELPLLTPAPNGSEDGLVERQVTLRRSEEHTSELQSRENLVCRLLLEKKKKKYRTT